MALDVTLVSPFMPRFPYAGGVAGGKAIFLNGDTNLATAGRFAVVDPAGSTRAFQMTAPGGYGLDVANGGASDGDSVWVPFRSGSSGAQPMWLARIWPDGSVDSYPSLFSQGGSWGLKVGQFIWSCSGGTSSWRRFDTTTMSWDTVAGDSLNIIAEPVVHGGYVWGWGGYGAERVDTTTMAATPVTTTGITGPISGAQVAVLGGYAWWPTATSGRLVRISASGVFDNVDAPVAFGRSLCVDSQGYLRSSSHNGVTHVGYNPATGASWSELTGASGSSGSCRRIYAIGSKTIAGVHT